MDKQTRNLLFVLVVAGAILYMGATPQQQAGILGATGIAAADGTIPTPGGQLTVLGGTPTIGWQAFDALTTKDISDDFAFGVYRVTVGASQSDYEYDDTIDVSLYQNYKVCLLPNATYYATCATGTTTQTTTTARISAYKIGSASAWINNDSEHATARNSNSAPDDVSSDDTDTPTVCFQGATANASYGDGAALVIVDYNALLHDSPPSLSAASRTANDKIPSGWNPDSNIGKSSVAFEFDGYLTPNDTKCSTMVVDYATIASGVEVMDIDVNVLDRFGYRHTTTDALEFGYAIKTNSNDTNSATNKGVRYVIV